MNKPKYIVFDSRQTLGESLVREGATFSFLLLCIWASQGSTWWTFFTALLFLLFVFAKFAAIVGGRQLKFNDIEALRAWVEQERTNKG